MVGRTISHYKILEKIGQGGMGEVYRAEDTSLKREVAIKVLPEQFTEDPQRLARFEREAQLLASLNHPNIAAIHSFEHSDDMHFLVLELVEGETLAERIVEGPLPVEETLEVCRQIAEGVEAAHEKGVIHRDLKPANVKITPEGKVKILDFGLAKAFEGETPVADISQSPTLTEEMTRAGVILGTAAYMSPEQAKGKPVDKRADIFAFGCVLYELLTGKTVFQGETITETIAAVLKSEPYWEALPENTPWRIQELLRRCLTKDVRDRLRDITNVRVEIKLALTEPATVSPTGVGSAAPPARQQWAVTVSLIFVAVVITWVVVWSLMRTGTPTQLPLNRFVINLPPAHQLLGQGLTLSPDGGDLVFVASHNSVQQLYHRSMDQLEVSPIPGTEGAGYPFFSPDGQWVGFFAEGKLKKVSLARGLPVTLCDAPEPTPLFPPDRDMKGASWGPDDTIVFSTGATGLLQVPAAGGIPQEISVLDVEKGEASHYAIDILPAVNAVLFTIAAPQTATTETTRIAVQSLETGQRHLLMDGTDPRYIPTGHIIFARTRSLWAVPFDVEQLQVTGPPVPVLEDIEVNLRGLAQFTLAGDGSLVYIPSATVTESTVVWVDRRGQATPLIEDRQDYRWPRLSPDGKRVVVTVPPDIWIYDIGRGTRMRLTVEESQDNHPVWTPDGTRVAFASSRERLFDLYWKPADGSGQAEPLLSSELQLFPFSWSPDGRTLLFYEVNPTTARDIWVLPLEGDASPFVATAANERTPLFSPDGRWVAYVSDESGRDEIYVQPYPGPGAKWPISTEGGTEPQWSTDGRELFYRQGNKMMVVAVQSEPSFTFGRPQLLFEGPYLTDQFANSNYDVSADGEQFLMVQPMEQEQPQLNVVLNWFEELKRLVPTN